MDVVRKTPTKTWLKCLDLQHLSTLFEENGFKTVGSLIAMDLDDLTIIFKPSQLKLGERRLLEQNISRLKQVIRYVRLTIKPKGCVTDFDLLFP